MVMKGFINFFFFFFGHKINYFKRGEIKIAEKEDVELIFPAKQIKKKNLHVEQSSLKTNWKLAEGLLHNQGYIKDTHIIR